MIFSRPKLYDYKIVGFFTGQIILGLGLLMVFPVFVGLFFREWSAVVDMSIGILVAVGTGLGLQLACRTEREMQWIHGLVTAAFSWLVAAAITAVPYYLSGHYGSIVDAYFDAMSGFTTTGLVLLQDMDHISNTFNMWRHLVTYAGGQGIIVIALTFLIRGTGGAFMIFVGEGKDEKLLPNVIQTARAIWLVSLAYLAVGVTVMSAALWIEGLSPVRSLLHGAWMFMSSWSTGGFAPQSYNAMYYHSLMIELLTMVFFVIGSFNFALHWAVWNADRREIYRNIELVSFMITLFITVSLGTYALMRLGVYADIAAYFRKGFYQFLSGHTTTGLMTIYGRQFVRQWGAPAMLITTVTMMLGASAASTAGGFKGLRTGIIFKSMVADVRRLMLPESAVTLLRIHHIRNRIIEDKQLTSVMLIVLIFLIIEWSGALLGSMYGYPFVEALFESVSAGSNSGLSVGITSPSMPLVLKLYFILAMWGGRLEFIAVFAIVGFLVRAARGR